MKSPITILEKDEQKRLFARVMEELDKKYDPELHLLWEGEQYHDVRDSGYYSLGLLARDGQGDRERAEKVIQAVLNLQMDGKEEDGFYGTFKRTEVEKLPPSEPFPGRCFDAHGRVYLEKWRETVEVKLKRRLMETGESREKANEIITMLGQSLCDTVPVVWEGFDPNWREFISTTFAMVLSMFEDKLDPQTVKAMDRAMVKSVTGSIARYNSWMYPMNTNVLLMHCLICIYYGERFENQEFYDHGIKALDKVIEDYKEFGNFAEFNSPTYYSVDLIALAAWKKLSGCSYLHQMGQWLEQELWNKIGAMYHPGLHNLCGPYSRAYETDMKDHTMLPSLLYIGLGAQYQEEPGFNCELGGNVELSILGTEIPSETRQSLLHYQGDRQVEMRYRELIEKNDPDDDSTVCTATAWIEENYMIGAMEGSRNTSHQLRSAVAFWKAPDGTVSNMVLMRREPGTEPAHIRTVFFNNRAEKGEIEIQVTFDAERDIELFFNLEGTGLETEMIQTEGFKLPGMEIKVETDQPAPEVRQTSQGLEVVYPFHWTPEGKKTMNFNLKFQWKKD